VTEAQKIRAVLIPRWLERLLTVLRIVLLLTLAAVLLDARQLRGKVFGKGAKAATALLAFWIAAMTSAHAQTPDTATLEKLRQRLLATSDAYPHAAEIPSVSLALRERQLTMDAEVHTAVQTAVPLPGKLPVWSPLTITVDGKPEAALRRNDGYLWLVLSPGTHRVRVEGIVAEASEWEWTFLLRPRYVTIDAPGWTITGVREDGVPEQQVFFVREQKTGEAAGTYERSELHAVAGVDRRLELGLTWQVQTVVTRISKAGEAIALKIPLLAGEKVLSSDATVQDGFIDVRLGAQQSTFTWRSELAITSRIALATRLGDSWAETWSLHASPVWNVTMSGLQPIFHASEAQLNPVWHPWPGESAELAISRPEAVPGATLAVSNASHEITLGDRQRLSRLELAVRSSLGEDFFPRAARRRGDHQAHAGRHGTPGPPGGSASHRADPRWRAGASLEWKTNVPLEAHARAGEVRLPVDGANIETVIHVPENRWVLWTYGPLRGPAVRFWGILVAATLAGWLLGRLPSSPLRAVEWVLLLIGLTQVPLLAAVTVVGWLFLLAWRGTDSFERLPGAGYNVLQALLIVLSLAALGILVAAVGAGLLGSPQMFIEGNHSTYRVLRWYQPQTSDLLPQPGCISVSVWWYRLLMLAWALWLASAVIRWAGWGWRQFSRGALFRRAPKKAPAPPPVPVTPA
jgi:hypothetical protein